jgi:hypothetical protein
MCLFIFKKIVSASVKRNFLIGFFSILLVPNVTSALGQTVPCNRPTAPQYLGVCEQTDFQSTAAVNAIAHKLGKPLHEIFLKNESRSSRAYCLGNAGMDNCLNGISFGLRQWDLARGGNSWKDFIAILSVADDSSGKPTLKKVIDAQEQLTRCIGPAVRYPKGDICNTHTQHPALDFNDPITQQAITAASTLLHTDKGKKSIDEKYISKLNATLRNFDTQVEQFVVEMGMGKLAKKSNAASLLILDYENLFGAGCFYAAMKATKLPTECSPIPRLAPESQEVTEGDLIRYILNTKQGKRPESTGERDIFRRIENVLKIAKFNPDLNLDIYARDKNYYAGEMANRLEGMKKRSREQGVNVEKTPILDSLIAAGK